MRAGASAEVWNYSTLAEDLASHGYVVVGFDAPYRTNVVVSRRRVMRRRPENNPELVSAARIQPVDQPAAGRVDRRHRVRARSVGAIEPLRRIRQVHGRLDLRRGSVRPLARWRGGRTILPRRFQVQAGIDVTVPH